MYPESQELSPPDVSGDAVSSPSERPSQRIQIGSQRKGVAEAPAEEAPKAKPVTPVTPPAPKKEPKHYPPPNVRDQLTPEMEAEYLAAMGELSLDKLIESDVAAAPPELEVESRLTGVVAKIHREDVFVDLPGTTRASYHCGSSKRRRRSASSWNSSSAGSTRKKGCTN